MALSDRNIVITPNKGKSDDPKIVFSGANAAVSAQNITLRVYPDNAGTLSFEGSAGQLFSITNSLSGTIFSVNDVSGIPSISVDSSGAILLSPFGGNVGIGTSSSFGLTSNVFSLYGTAMIYGNIDLANTTNGNTGIYFPDGTFMTTAAGGASSFGTAGTIQYAGAGNTFAGNSGSLFWNTASNRLGIGTSAPNSVLNVNATTVPLFQTSNALIGGNNYEIMVGNSTVHGVTLGYVNNTTVPYGYLSAGITTRNITIAANGRVGIGGITAPQNLLEVGGTTVMGGTWAGNTNFINAPANGLAVQGSVGVGTYTPLSTLDVNGWAGFRQGLNAAGAVTVASLTSNAAVGGTVVNIGGSAIGSNKLSITAGSLGTTLNSTVSVATFYSTTSNADYLEFLNIRNASGGTDWTTAGNRIQERVDATYMAWIGFNNGNTTVTNNGGISFGTGLSAVPNGVPERLRIDSSGNVGIATTTVQTGFTLQVQGNSAFTNRIGVGTSAIAGVGNAAAIYGTANLFGNIRISNTAPGGSGIYFPDGTFQSTAFSSTINLSRQSYTATASQTTFTVTAGYLPGALDVYQNGAKLNIPLDVTATNGSTFVLASPATLGDIIEAVGYGGSLVTIANSVPLGGGTMTGDLGMSSGTRSTSTATGAIVVTTTGGIGIGGNLYAGGNVVAASMQPTSASIPPTGIYLPSANTIGFSTGGAARMQVTSNGNLIVGTTTGNVFNTTGSARVVVIGGQAGTDNASLSLVTPGFWQGELSDLAMYSTFQSFPADSAPRRSADIISGFNGSAWSTEYLSFNVGNNGAANDTNAVTVERMRINGAGNVGIATTNPQDRVHVFSGNISVGDPATNVTVITSSYITLSTQGNTPVVPPAGEIQLFSKNLAGRSLLAQQGPSGIDTTFTPLVGRNRVYYWAPVGLNTTTAPTASLSATAFTTVGTATARAFATTNIRTRMTRMAYVSTTTAGTLASMRVATAWLTTGTGTGLGGFFYVSRFGVSDATTVAGARMFVGLSSTTGAATNVDPATLTNSFGVAQLSTDNTQWYFVYGGSAAQAAIALGTTLGAPTLTTTSWDLALFSSPGANGVIGYTMTNIGTGVSVTGVITPGTPGTQTPANTTALTSQMWRTNNATAAAVAIDFMSLYIETDD